MKNKATSFYGYVHKSLNAYRWAISIAVSLVVAFIFAGITLTNKIESDKHFLSVLAPYFSTLIESEDRPEVLRFLHSITKNTDIEVVVIHNGVVFANSKTIVDLDLPYARPKTNFRISETEFNRSQIVSRVNIESKNGGTSNAEIFLINPLRPILTNIIALAFAALCLCLVFTWISGRRMRIAIKRALEPLSLLHSEIKKLHQNIELGNIPIQIRELEEIRMAIFNTKVALDNAKDCLAEEKAKKLSADAYKRLIHDLHSPVASLGQMVRILTNPETETGDYLTVVAEVPKVAEQILNQVSAAKNNLENQPESLRELDLRICVQSSFDQVMRSLDETKLNRLSINIPADPIISAHDPVLLQRAITNLIENAIEASKKKVVLTLEKNKMNALIKVLDDGCGMDESKVSLYMQGKGQSNKAARQAFGLSSVNHIVRSHGGKVIYRKSEMGGASFEIRLEASV